MWRRFTSSYPLHILSFLSHLTCPLVTTVKVEELTHESAILIMFQAALCRMTQIQREGKQDAVCQPLRLVIFKGIFKQNPHNVVVRNYFLTLQNNKQAHQLYLTCIQDKPVRNSVAWMDTDHNEISRVYGRCLRLFFPLPILPTNHPPLI